MQTRNLLVTSAFLLPVLSLIVDQVPVRYQEGHVHGFLMLRDLDDNLLASGTLIQSTRGNTVTTELSFHFKNGSAHQETAVYSQRRLFRLLSIIFQKAAILEAEKGKRSIFKLLNLREKLREDRLHPKPFYLARRSSLFSGT